MENHANARFRFSKILELKQKIYCSCQTKLQKCSGIEGTKVACSNLHYSKHFSNIQSAYRKQYAYIENAKVMCKIPQFS